MANFRIGENGQGISKFDLPCGRGINLVQWGGDAEGNRLELGLVDASAPFTLTTHSTKLAAASTLFTVRGNTPGSTAKVTACLAGSGHTKHYSEMLSLTVKGTPQKQPGYEVDLIANMAISGNAKQVFLYSQIVDQSRKGCTAVLGQRTTGVLNCGDTAAKYSPLLFGTPTFKGMQKYYLPAKSKNALDLRFNPQIVTAGFAKIKAQISKGHAVWLWCIHDDGFTIPEITDKHPTHYVAAVGFAGNKLLYIDPWPGGSKLAYDGGMYPSQVVPHFGELYFTPGDAGFGLHAMNTGGSMRMIRVIAGP